MQACHHEKERQLDQDIELIDIEDIVPAANSNSLFLCVSRALIYLTYKNDKLLKALKTCCSITESDLRSDIHLQSVLRVKLCEYLLNSAIDYDKETKMPFLRPEYSAHFDDNIYDFLIQLYQLSVNNFSSNSLYTKFAFKALSKMLNLNIWLKKVNGTWKFYEPVSQDATNPIYESIDGTMIDVSNSSEASKEYRELLKYLNELQIYLYEFRTSNSRQRRKSVNPLGPIDINNGLKRQHASISQSTEKNKSSTFNRTFSTSAPSNSKILKMLMNKRLWLKNYYVNSTILKKFAQFNDPDELQAYSEHKILLNPIKLISVFKEVLLRDESQLKNARTNLISQIKIFSAFVLNAPVDLLINCERDQCLEIQASSVSKRSKTENQGYGDILEEIYFSSKYNTLGKQFVKFFESRHSSKRFSPQDLLMMFLNHIWGKQMFNEEFVHKTIVYISNEITSF